jgi:hypothetical protein
MTDSSERYDSDDGAWQVGTAQASLTPDADEPHHLIGLSAREGPMDGVEHDIHARAVAFRDHTGRRLVFVSFELLSVPPSQREYLSAECEERWGLDPEALFLNPTHNHYGPDYFKRDDDLVADYRTAVDETLLDVIGEALADLEPARLWYHRTRCAIAINRRNPTEERFHFDPYPDGPTDHDLPVLRAETADGTTKALLFGYACHPTVATGSNRLHGDWPGYAMARLEAEYPDATAAFVIGAAGDQRAYPQGTVDLAERHGRTVATAVQRALVTDPRPVRGPLRLAADEIGLDIESPVEGEDGDAVGKTVTDHRPYPLQAAGFGTDLTLLSLSGEVCAETGRRLKETLAAPVWVAGYANRAGYIPTKRILAEGGYESWSSGADGTYAPTVEERVRRHAVALAERVGARRRDA